MPGRGSIRVVVEIRPEPFLAGGDGEVFAGGVVLDLVLREFADGEILRVRVVEVVAGDGTRRVHGVALGERDAGELGVLDRARLAISSSLFNFYMALLSFEIS